MEVKEQIKLTFSGVDIFNIQFTCFKSLPNSTNVDLQISPKVFYPIDNPLQFKILFDVIVKVDGFFNLSIQAVGHFLISSDTDEKLKKNLVNTNAPAIMFPYIRAFITTFTSNIGGSVGTIVLPPHFFNGEIEELTKDASSEQIPQD